MTYDLNGDDSATVADDSMGIEACAHVGTNPSQQPGSENEIRPAPHLERQNEPVATNRTSSLERETLRADARTALVSLGFRRGVAGKAVDLALTRVGSAPSLEGIIREALRSCART